MSAGGRPYRREADLASDVRKIVAPRPHIAVHTHPPTLDRTDALCALQARRLASLKEASRGLVYTLTPEPLAAGYVSYQQPVRSWARSTRAPVLTSRAK